MSFKENDKELIEWYKKEVAKQGIDIRFNTEVTDLAPCAASTRSSWPLAPCREPCP